MKYFFCIMLMLASLAVMSCASNEVAKTCEEKTITISLESNRTAGYSWACEIDKPQIAELIADEYIIDKSIIDKKGIVGAGGVQKFTISLKKQGRATIKFSYIRPWEKEAKPEKEIIYNLSVCSNLDYKLDKPYVMSLSDVVYMAIPFSVPDMP